MVRSLWALVLALSWTATLIARPALAETVVVNTLEWPPYTSAELPRGGATTDVITQAFAAAGIESDVKYLPWKRAISSAKDDGSVAGYFPGYHCRHVEGFIASNPIGAGPLGFAEHTSAPVTWESIDDIGKQKLKIGTVLGYSNTDEFDEKAGTGWIRSIPAPDDLTNLRKLVRQRIDMAVIDKLVLSYILATEPSLSDDADSLQFNARPLEDKTLYLCFIDDEAGRAMRDIFNAGLATIDIEKTVEDYFENQF
ncbi:MAG: transporter substrate-binding domain-containing protein [Alphaproteobacteria bacterium]|nr:transporter substrate-binding domain-containing protein [Alphaproteobacteria bacterium]